jgi:flagellar hook-length control protein FliK
VADAPAVPTVLTAPTTALRAEHVAAPEPAPAATPAPPRPPAEQLVNVLRPLQRDADGTYTLKLEMKPPELGRVEMRIEVRDGVMHAAIRTEHAHTAELVRNALDDLRARLDADGVTAGRLSVDDGRSGAHEREESPRPSGQEQPEPVAPVATSRPVAVTQSDALVDVRV